MRLWRSVILALAVGFLTPTYVAAQSGDVGGTRPNILFVYIDDLGFGDLGCYGNNYFETTSIDQLAAEGARFEQFYVASPICSPSRVAITTGQYPAKLGIHSYLASRRQNRRRGMKDFLDPEVATIARLLQRSGYATAHFGKWHMGGGRDVNNAPLPTAYGFDESLVSFEGLGDRILPPGGLSEQSAALGQGTITRVEKHQQTEIYVDRALDFIQRQAEANQPFYVQVWPNDVHDALQPSDEQLAHLRERFDLEGANPPEWSAYPSMIAYYAVLLELDRQIGRLIEGVDQLGLKEQTLVVISSDNGPTAWPSYQQPGNRAPGSTRGLRGRKWSLYEGGIREPLIVRWPGHIPAGYVDDNSVLSAIDLFPTFARLAGVDVSGLSLDGQPVEQVWMGEPLKSRDAPLYFEYGRDPSYLRPAVPVDQSPNLAIRDGRWKLLMEADESRLELYDFESSQQEFANVAGKHPDVVDALQSSLREWKESLPGYGPDESGFLPVRQIIQSKIGHTVESQNFPDVAHSEVEIHVRVTTNGSDGVLVAHGGSATGYALYMQDGIPHFTWRVNSQPVTLRADEPLLPERMVDLHAGINREQQLFLKLNGRNLVEPVAGTWLSKQPGDPFDVGFDQVSHVGEYDDDFRFGGTIHQIGLLLHRVDQTPTPGRMVTRWADEVSHHQRGLGVNAEFADEPNQMLLNGEWEYAFSRHGESLPAKWLGRMQFPFPIESLLSDVQVELKDNQSLWVHRKISIPPNWEGRPLVIHTGRSSGLSEVWINGMLVERQAPIRLEQQWIVGRSDRADQDVTVEKERAVSRDPFDVVLRFETQRPPRSALLNPLSIEREPRVFTGPYEPVWLEVARSAHVMDIQAMADPVSESVRIEVETQGTVGGQELGIQVLLDGRVVGRQSRTLGDEPTPQGQRSRFELPIESPMRWSPDSPTLYEIRVEIRDDGESVQVVKKRIGFRSIDALPANEEDVELRLNGERQFLVATLYHAWWPDGMAAAPSDEALRFDLETVKQLGFNAIWLPDTVGCQELYSIADEIGLLIIQGIPKEQDSDDHARLLNRLTMHPSVIGWRSPKEVYPAILDVDTTDEAVLKQLPAVAEDQSQAAQDNVAQNYAARDNAAQNMLTSNDFQFDLHENSVNDQDTTTRFQPSKEHIHCLIVTRRPNIVRGHAINPADDLERVEPAGVSIEQVLDSLLQLRAQGLDGVVIDSVFDFHRRTTGMVTYDRAIFKVDQEATAARLKRLRDLARPASE